MMNRYGRIVVDTAEQAIARRVWLKARKTRVQSLQTLLDMFRLRSGRFSCKTLNHAQPPKQIWESN